MPKASTEVYRALKDVLGLPDHCTKVELHLATNDIALVRCEYYPNPLTEPLKTALAEFKLVKRGPVEHG